MYVCVVCLCLIGACLLVFITKNHGPLCQVDGPGKHATPSMQNAMRTTQTKSLKRGRKPKKGKTSKAKASKVAKKVRKGKRSILKSAKGKGKGKKTPKTESVPVETAVTRKRGKTSPSGSAEPKVSQNRFGEGKTWVYEVLENQVYGCRSCRFIFGGCHHCRKPEFRGKSASQVRKEQQASFSSGGTEDHEEAKKVKKVKKVKKGKGKTKMPKGTKKDKNDVSKES